jgi:transcriptional regulator with XRE-family HTH domain
MDDRALNEHIGRKLRFRRRLLGLTQAQVGGQLGVRFQQVQKWECGVNRMSAAQLYLVAERLEISICFFFEGYARAEAA